MASAESAFSTLPTELFLLVLDILVEELTPHGQPHHKHQRIAFPPDHTTTKTLLALTRVSRNTYAFASRYLYANCLYINDEPSFTLLRRTLGFSLGDHPKALRDGELGRNEELWKQADVSHYVSSAYITPNAKKHSRAEKASTTLVRLPHFVDFFATMGSHLKKLVLELSPAHIPLFVETERPKSTSKSNSARKNILPSLPLLEELVVDVDITYWFSTPLPHLKRLCTTYLGAVPDSFLSIPSLNSLILRRPNQLTAAKIGSWFSEYTGTGLDILLVNVNSNHRTPTGTQSWKEDDKVRIWEIDVPTSFYGDDDNLVLCKKWIWEHARNGRLWEVEKRRMMDWEEIRKRVENTVNIASLGPPPAYDPGNMVHCHFGSYSWDLYNASNHEYSDSDSG